MNNPPPPHSQTVLADPDALDLAAIVDLVIENRLLISLAVAVCLAAGTLYSLLREPVFRADILVQIEDSTNAQSAGMLANIAPLLDMKSTADAEIQLLGSRLVVSRAVDGLHLYVDARPHYFPVIGRWIASRGKRLSEPGIAGFGGYVWGAEAIDVGRFDVPRLMEGDAFTITANGSGRFTLSGSDLDAPVAGSVGKTLTIASTYGPIVLRVDRLDGRAGAAFDLRRLSRLATIEALQSQLDIKQRGKDSDVLAAAYDGTDPVLVSEVLNEIGRQYVEQNVRRKTEEAQRSIDFLDAQMPVLARSLDEAEARYNETRSRLNTVSLGEEAALVLQQSADVQTQLGALQQKRLELAAQLTPSHPAMRALDAQIASLEMRAKQIDARIAARPMIEQDVLRATRDVQVDQQLYLALRQNLQQLQLVKAGKVGSVRLVDKAPVPEKPIWPRPLIVLPLAALGGLLLGLGAALVRSRLFRGVTDSRDIERFVGLDVYATVPDSATQRKLEKRQQGCKEVMLLARRAPDDPAIESLRSFRTALRFLMIGSIDNRVLFTGASPGVGKSFVSANCAALLAGSGSRVLLIDADLRQGHIHRYFGRERDVGFADLLAGWDVDVAIQRGVLENLDFISTGTPSRGVDLLLQATHLGTLLAQLSAQYDVVIVDSAPTLSVADSTILAQHCGSVFLVALAGTTKVAELDETVKRLRQVGVRPKGSIFNRVNPALGRYGYGAAYGGYRYAGTSYGAASRALL